MSDNPHESLMYEYLDLTALIDEFSSRRDEVKTQLLEQLPEKTTRCGDFVFTKTVRTAYTYTDAIKEQEKALRDAMKDQETAIREAKQKEVEQGLAEAKVTEILTVRKGKTN